MSLIKRKKREMPGLNTASLPDLIFTVLFFFMIVTHMKNETVLVRYEQPEGQRLERIGSQPAVIHIYIGHTPDAPQGPFCLQADHRLMSTAELRHYLQHRYMQTSDNKREELMVALQADKDVPMGMIDDVKQAMREAGILRIHYTGIERSAR